MYNLNSNYKLNLDLFKKKLINKVKIFKLLIVYLTCVMFLFF